MPSVDLFDGTTDPDNHLDVYKAQMYIQDVHQKASPRNGSVVSQVEVSLPSFN